MNRLRLDGNDQIITIPFNNVNIIGTGANESVYCDIGIGNIEVNVGDSDGIYLGKDSTDYDITSPGGNIVEVSDGSNTVTISVSGSGQIGFVNGKTSLSIDSGTGSILVDTTTVTSTPIDNTALSFTTLPTEIIEAGPSSSTFTKIIDGGYADSTYA